MSAVLRVLVLSGRNDHDFRATTPVIRRVLEESGRFAVEAVLEDPSRCDAAILARCDVVVSNWSAFPDLTGRRWGAAAEKAFLEFVRAGKGFLAVHAASATCQDWPEFQGLVGLTWCLGRTGHGAIHAFPVEVEDRGHPIARGLNAFFTVDELWHEAACLAEGKPEVICKAFSSKESGGSGRWEPVLVATRLGKGRGVNLVLGHDVQAMRNAGWRTLLLRAGEWAATGEVTVSIPEDWPATAALASAQAVDPEAAIAAVAGHRAGRSRRTLAAVEELVRAASTASRGGAPSRAQRELAAMIASALPSSATVDAKAFLLKQLSFIGTEKEAPALAPFLLDGDLSHAVRSALERIPGPAAEGVLRGILGRAMGKLRVGIVNSLGNRRVRAAAGDLKGLLGDPDRDLCSAAAGALGKIGGEEAAKALVEALARTSGAARAIIGDACLECAGRLLAGGDRAGAEAIYRRLDAPEESDPVRGAARRGLEALGREAPGGSKD